LVFKPLSEGKKASWLASLDYPHSFTYTPDAGKATAILGNTKKAYNQIWHLPTAKNPYTGRQWIETIAEEMAKNPKCRTLSQNMLNLLGIFVPVLKEMSEMIYQYDRDYVFDSQKIEKEFEMKATPYLEGIKEIIDSDY
jgi:nucleoside-diphosphate-sugar epimerase